MKKTIKIEFGEQSKGFTADVKIEYISEEGEKFINSEVLQEAIELYDKATNYTATKSMKKQ